MRKFIFPLLLCSGFMAFSQILDVSSIEKVKMEQGDNIVTKISPKGDYILVTSGNKAGLRKVDLANGEMQVITTVPGSGVNPIISEDGKDIVYRKKCIEGKQLRKTAVIHHNLISGAENEIVAPTRRLESLSFAGGRAIAKVNGKLYTRKITSNVVSQDRPIISNANLKLTITHKGVTKELAPNGLDCRYIWSILSPNATKIAYYTEGYTYVCDLEGENVKCLGRLSAAKWYDDNTLVGMVDSDNGEFITESIIKAVTLDGIEQVLTNTNYIALYPQPSREGGKIVFSTPFGEAYIINIK